MYIQTAKQANGWRQNERNEESEWVSERMEWTPTASLIIGFFTQSSKRACVARACIVSVLCARTNCSRTKPKMTQLFVFFSFFFFCFSCLLLCAYFGPFIGRHYFFFYGLRTLGRSANCCCSCICEFLQSEIERFFILHLLSPCWYSC